MRDYKGHSSRAPETPEREVPRPAAQRPKAQGPTAEDLDTGAEPVRRRSRFWPWVVLLVLIVLIPVVAVTWLALRISLSPQQLGLRTAAPSRVTTSVPVAAGTRSQRTSSPASQTAATASPVSPAASTDSSVRFNFYRILPQMQVEIPPDILGSGPGIPSVSTTSSAFPGSPVRIEVGAMNNRAGAEILQQRLALMGISSRVEPVSGVSGQGLYYRVLTRPYASLDGARSALAKIRGMGLTPKILEDSTAPTVSGTSAFPGP